MRRRIRRCAQCSRLAARYIAQAKAAPGRRTPYPLRLPELSEEPDEGHRANRRSDDCANQTASAVFMEKMAHDVADEDGACDAEQDRQNAALRLTLGPGHQSLREHAGQEPDHDPPD